MMNFEDSLQQNSEPYYGYRGQEAPQHYYTDQPGQKLRINEKEQFAEMLIERMKEELPEKLHGVPPWHSNHRLLLALASLTLITLLCALAIIAVAFGHISAAGATALGYGLVTAMIVIGIVYNTCNKSLHSNSVESNIRKPEDERKSALNQPEEQAKTPE